MPLEPVAQALQDAVSKKNFGKALGFCNKKLAIDAGNEPVKKTKCLCFIQLGQYENALEFIDTLDVSLAPSFVTEKAYSLYKLRKHEETLAILDSVTSPSIAQQHLLAQTYYRLGNYKKNIELLSSIAKKEESPEIKVNIAAANCMSGIYDKETKKEQEANEQSFELAFNVSCILLQQSDLKGAEQQLIIADKIGREILPQLDYSDAEIEDELSGVKVQLAFIYQLTNREKEAVEIYEEVLKAKPSDSAIMAIASNNAVSLHSDHKLFNAEKTLFNAISAAQEHKLTSLQQKIINFNRAIVYFKMGKMEKCREVIQTLKSDFPTSPLPALILAATLFKEKKSEEGEKALEEAVQSKGDQEDDVSSRVTLLNTVADYKLGQSNFQEASDLLKQLIELDPGNKGMYLSKLVIALYHVDPKLAASYAEDIPVQTFSTEDMDIDKLENISSHTRSRETVAETTSDVLVERKKKKKKKKKRLPKNYDPNVTPDPERWLPRNQRSSFKKRSKKKMRGGHQGGADAQPAQPAKKATPAPAPKKNLNKKKKKKGGLR